MGSVQTAGMPFGMRVVGAPPEPAAGEVVGVMVARNEALRIGAAIRHARRLGIGPVIVIDNLSSDDTRAVATSLPRVSVIEAPESYTGSGYGIDWINAVLDRFARGHWALMFDADELLVFPGSELENSLPLLCAHLDSLGAEGLRTIMLDCFPGGPLHATRYRPEQELLEAAPWFEPPKLWREAAPNFPYVAEYGGIRERLFFPNAAPGRPLRAVYQKLYNLGWRLPMLRQARWFQRAAPGRPPNLTKVPLVRWRDGTRFLTAHSVTPLAMAPRQPSGVLLHFKFLQDFHDRVVDAVRRKAHFDGSVEYRRYLAALRRDPDVTLRSARSLRYAGTDQLVRLGLMHDTPEWVAARSLRFSYATESGVVRAEP